MRSNDYITPEYREKISNSSKKYWANLTEEEREVQCQKVKDSWTPERRQARREMMARRMADPEASAKYRANLSAAVRASNLRPEVIQKRKIASQISSSDPEYRKKIKDRMNQPWNKELNSKVRGPLGRISRDLKEGRISEEEAKSRREELYIIKQEIHEKYKEEELQYKLENPPKRRSK